MKAAREARRPDAGEFEKGRHWAYHEVLTLMLDQAETFALSPDDLGLDGFDPDRDIRIYEPATTEPADRRRAAATEARMGDHNVTGRARWWTLRRFFRTGDRRRD